MPCVCGVCQECNWAIHHESVDEYFDGEVMSMKEFIDNVKLGAYTDYDGHGYLFFEGQEGTRFVPSELKNLKVRWFNK